MYLLEKETSIDKMMTLLLDDDVSLLYKTSHDRTKQLHLMAEVTKVAIIVIAWQCKGISAL